MSENADSPSAGPTSRRLKCVKRSDVFSTDGASRESWSSRVQSALGRHRHLVLPARFLSPASPALAEARPGPTPIPSLKLFPLRLQQPLQPLLVATSLLRGILYTYQRCPNE